MISPCPSFQDQGLQIQAAVEQPYLEPSGILTEPLEAVEAAVELLSGDVLRSAIENYDALVAAVRKLSNLAMRTLNSSEPLEEDLVLSDQEKKRLIQIEIGRLIQSPDIDSEIQKRVLESQGEALSDKAVANLQLIAVRRTQSKARNAVESARKPREKVKLAESKNKENKERTLGVYARALERAYEALEEHAMALQRLAEVVKKHAETRGALAKAIESLVTALYRRTLEN